MAKKEIKAVQVAQVQELLEQSAIVVGKGEEWPEDYDVATRSDVFYIKKAFAKENEDFFVAIEELIETVNAQFGDKRHSVYTVLANDIQRKLTLLTAAEKAIRKESVANKTSQKLLVNQQKQLDAAELIAHEITSTIREAVLQIADMPVSAPIINMVKPKGDGTAVPMLFLSDIHLEATVDPVQVNNLNKFNLEIAENRFNTCFENFAKTMFSMKNCGDQGVVVALGGDLFEGYIHDECRINGSVPIAKIMKLFVEWMYPQLVALSKQFKQVYVPAVVGNHGRIDKGYIMQNKAVENFEFMALQMLEARCAHIPNIKIDISSATDALFSVNGHRFLMTHGDQCKSAGGVGGIYPSLLKLHYRKTERASAMGLTYDTMILGHFHQYHDAHDIVVNGSLKGLDNYAFESNFKFEPPRQAAWLVDAEYGRVCRTPIYCQDKVKFLNRGNTSELIVSEMVQLDESEETYEE